MSATRRLAVAAIAVASLVSSVAANTVVSRSPLQAVVFDYPESPLLLPYSYTWQGLVIVDYDSYYDPTTGVNRVTINRIDQSVTVYGGANFGNPCDINLSISTDGYDHWGNYYWTLYVDQPGSYWQSPNDLVWGGVTYPGWSIPGPTLRATAVASAGCLPYSASFSWDIPLP